MYQNTCSYINANSDHDIQNPVMHSQSRGACIKLDLEWVRSILLSHLRHVHEKEL
jgi:hypothetical protein